MLCQKRPLHSIVIVNQAQATFSNVWLVYFIYYLFHLMCLKLVSSSSKQRSSTAYVTSLALWFVIVSMKQEYIAHTSTLTNISGGQNVCHKKMNYLQISAVVGHQYWGQSRQ